MKAEVNEYGCTPCECGGTERFRVRSRLMGGLYIVVKCPDCGLQEETEVTRGGLDGER